MSEKKINYFQGSYYSKEYKCTQDALQEMEIFIQDIPKFFENTSIYEFPDAIREVQQRLIKMVSLLHHNIEDFKIHFDHIIDFNEVMMEKVRMGKFFKGSAGP